MRPDDHDDAELLALVGEAFDDDLAPMPDELFRFAADAGRWASLDDELATLVFDSAVDVAAGARATTATRRTLRFQGSGLTVSVSIDERSLVVAVEPAGRYTGHLARPTNPRRDGRDAPDRLPIETDDDGQLAVAEWPAPVRVELDLPDGRFVSPWIIG